VAGRRLRREGEGEGEGYSERDGEREGLVVVVGGGWGQIARERAREWRGRGGW